MRESRQTSTDWLVWCESPKLDQLAALGVGHVSNLLENDAIESSHVESYLRFQADALRIRRKHFECVFALLRQLNLSDRFQGVENLVGGVEFGLLCLQFVV